MKKDNTQSIHRELSTLLKFSALVNSSLKIEDVLENAMKWSEEFIDAEASSIYELDEDNKELFIRLARGDKKEPVKKTRLKLGEGIAGYVAETKKPMVIQNVHKEKKFSNRFDNVTGFKTRSMICVPLTIRDKSLGAFQVLNKKNNKLFSHADLELMTGMAQQIAVALENARLYSKLAEKFELTELELKRTQNKLIRTERLAAVGNLVNGVAHEIRNPIMTIGGFARRIQSSMRENKKMVEYSDVIISETARLEKLVKQIHEFASVQSASLSSGRISAVIEKVLENFSVAAEKQGVQIVQRIPENIPALNMEFDQLTTALSNILENALESIPEAGVIEIIVDTQDHKVRIQIIDNGIGIKEDELASVFDPFVTSKTRGAGLGLTMVNQIINNHDGEISIKNRESQGTIVTILLPFADNNIHGG